jgi:putative transposase
VSDSTQSRDRLWEIFCQEKESLVKRQYQIRGKRAAENFRKWALSTPTPIQLTFPLTEVAELAQTSLGDLLRGVGKLFIETVMETEVEQIAGKRSAPDPNRSVYRWGTEDGFCLIDGQRVPIQRPRMRSRTKKEVPLGSYEFFQRSSLLDDTVWQKVMLGLTMRSYKEVVQQFADAYGLEKSTTCEHFIRASREKLKHLMERSLAGLSLPCMFIDGTIFKGQSLVVAVGVDPAGHKLVLGLRQGATENAAVVGSLLGELAERGLDFTAPRLYVVDGGKAIRSAIVNYAGEAAFIQRCQVHKIRNVIEHIPERDRPTIKYRMRCAYAAAEPTEGRLLLLKLHDELMQSNPSAAGSLAEGMDDCLTVAELRLTPKLRQTLSSTNLIESGFSVVDRICEQVKRWQGSDHRLRWIGSALLFAESRWNRVLGYRHMPVLVTALRIAYASRCGQTQASLHAEVTAA